LEVNPSFKSLRNLQLFLAGSTCLLIAIASGLSETAQGYEISFYQDLTPVFWIALASGFLFFAGGLLDASTKSHGTNMAVHLVGLTVLNSTLVTLPALKYGTYYTQWDVWFHLGQALSINRTGYVDLSVNVYPSLHLLWVATAQLVGIPVYPLGQVFGAPLEAVRIPLVFVLATRLFNNKPAASLAAALSAIPDGIVGTYPSPWFYSLALLLALILVLVIRAEHPGTASSLITLLLATSFVISHPLGPLFLVTAFAILAVLMTIRKLSPSLKNRVSSGDPGERGLLRLAVYLLVLYLAYIALLTLVLQTSITRLVEAFGTEGIVSPISFGRFFTLVLLAKVLGAYAVVGLYWIAGLLILRRMQVDRPRVGVRLTVWLTFSGLVIGVLFLSIASPTLLSDFIQRPLDVLILLLPVFGGFFIERLRHSFSHRSAKAFVTHGALIIPFLVAAAAMYPSPYVALFNYQNTQQLYSSLDWVAVNAASDATVLSNSYAGRYAYYPMLAGDQRYLKLYHFRDTLPADLFQLEANSNGRTYLVLDKETISVASLDLRAWRFPSAQDSEVIRMMLKATLVYDNGEVQVYVL